MKRVFLLSSITVAGVTLGSAAQGATHAAPSSTPEPYDSVQVERLNEVIVKSVKASKEAPFAVTNVNKKQLKDHSVYGQEIPFLMQMTPSVVASSDNGLGIGTCYLRVRGTSDSRINFTLDGMSLNDSEDQCVFWANMNGYSNVLGSMQIQRGVGTSTNGSGAFGATVALTSKAPSTDPTVEVTGSYGSYNTSVLTAYASSGLLWDQLVVDAGYAQSNTDGYIDYTHSHSGSFYGGLSWYGNNLIIRYKNFGNFESTDQAWDGISNDMYDAGFHKFNSLNEYYDEATGKMVKYPFTTSDNYWQDHNILSAAVKINDNWSSSISLRYTHGHGYYTNYKPETKLKKFGLSNENISKANFIRKKGLKNDTWSANYNLNYKNEAWDIVGGLSYQYFNGNHYGDLTYAKTIDTNEDLNLTNDEAHYYDSDADKTDFSSFIKASYHFNENWTAFADMQYRYVHYTTNGKNDKFYEKEDGSYANQMLDVKENFNFCNPKAGISYHNNGHNAYASFAMANREPSRNNYTDNGSNPFPKHETLLDYELGYNHTNNWFNVGANLYYMGYNNQLVQTGETSDIGEALTTNIKDSYRMGIELTAGVNFCKWLNLQANATFSQNKAKDYTEYVEDWEAASGVRTVFYDKTDLSFSPNVIANGALNYHWNGIAATFATSYVGRQYLDNTGCKARSLDDYCVSNFRASYTLQANHFCGLREVVFGVQVNNIFDKEYCANGWVYSAISESDGYTNNNRYTEIGYFPMAGTTAMGTISLKF